VSIRSTTIIEEVDFVFDRMGDDELAVALGLGTDADDVVALVNGDRITGDDSKLDKG